MTEIMDAGLKADIVAVLDHLSGISQGSQSYLYGIAMDVYLLSDNTIHVDAPGGFTPPKNGQLIARLHASNGSYEVEALNDLNLWINGRKAEAHRLESGDVIEFGDRGPLSRFYLCNTDAKPRMAMGEIFTDASAYFRSSRKPFLTRLSKTITATAKRMLGQTTLLFRIGVLVAIAGIIVFVYQQQQLNKMLQQDLAEEREKLRQFSQSLERAEAQSLKPEDLKILRDELDESLTRHTGRLEALEQMSVANSRIIAAATPFVFFLQGSYAYRNSESGEFLRFALGPGGQPLVGPAGGRAMTLGGEGPIVERNYTGTGFLLGSSGRIVTNRHVAIPWENDPNLKSYGGRGLKPEFVRFIAYRPGTAQSEPVKLIKASDSGDVAIVQIDGKAPDMNGLVIADSEPEPGNTVIVMGYPTGLRAMLAQAGKTFVSELRSTGDTDFWKVAEQLASKQHIQPLASLGIVAKTTPAAIVYDADTTTGGSGGPVLNAEGKVIAVNSAILPEYGGSNIGVPLKHLKDLLATIEQDTANANQ